MRALLALSVGKSIAMKLSPGNSNDETRRRLGYKDGDDAAHLDTDSRDGAGSRLQFDYAFLDFLLQRCFQGSRLKMMSVGVFVSLACWLLWLQTAHASPASMPRTNGHGAPTVTVKNGTYSGVYSSSYKQDFFLGMPYAQKAERFAVAKELNSSWTDVKTATAYPPHCIGYGGDDIGYAISEDCLYLNVIRHAGLQSTAGLPVAVWIHGGGLVMGGSADRRYNLSFIVENSVKLGTPMVAVSLNYRLSAFGFMMGKEAMSVGSTNIGFRDQRLALHWVHENIAAFGGDPAKVTIWGESSGAESVSAQILAYNGRDDKLFRGVIGESGFGGVLHRYPGGFNATNLMQQTYDNLVRNTSCASTVGTLGSFDCLKKVSLDELNRAINVTGVGPWAPVLDNDFIADFASNQLAAGNFPKVPVMMGCNTEEGTAFGPGRGPNGGGVQTDADMRAAIRAIMGAQAPSNTGKSADELIDELMYLYPNIQSIGIPSLETWPHVLVKGDNYSALLGLQYRRTGALFGDFAMQYARRTASLAWSQAGIPSFAYRFNVLVNPLPEYVGATHFQEVAFVFNNINGNGYAANPFGGSGSYPEKAKKLSKAMSYAWVNFITSQDPNGRGKPVLGVEWPAYNASVGGGSGQDIVFDIDENHVEMDDWRAEGMNWMKENSLAVFGT